MAFGNPRGLEGSVSMGIVSSIARELHPDDFLAYIQTDAPINPGNSGGPLMDSQGRVVGINTFILSESGGSEGLGFAIPSNTSKRVQAASQGRARASRKDRDLRADHHARLPMVWLAAIGECWLAMYAGRPAEKAGVKAGDVVETLNGRTMRNARQLESYIYRSPMREKVTLQVLRGKDELSIDVPVIDSVDDPQRFADMVNPEDNLVPKLGILAIGIDKMWPPCCRPSQLLRRSGGCRIQPTDLTTGTGLQAGDVIYSVNRAPVATVEALRNKVDEFKAGDEAAMQIERPGG